MATGDWGSEGGECGGMGRKRELMSADVQV